MAASRPAPLLPFTPAGVLGVGVGVGWFSAKTFDGVFETSVPASIAFCCNGNVVETTGHPFPGPFRFWRVMEAAVSLADLSALESPVGNDTDTVGLLRAFPA